MVTLAPAHQHIVVIAPRGTPTWLRDLTETCGFTPVINIKAILKRATREQLPDCVIGAPTVRVLGMFESLREAMELPQRPLLILLSDTLAPVSVADYVWPPQTELLLHNLNAALAMRAQWRELVDQRSAGASANDLERLIDLQTRTTSDLHLLKDTVVTNIAHELRTPLMHLKGALTYLGDENYADNHEEMYDYAVTATARLEELISNITLLAGAFRSDGFNDVYLPDALDQALRNLRRNWAQRGRTERVRVLDFAPLPLVRCNQRAISIVLQLLIDNALKFSDDLVEVEFQAGHTHVQVTIRDRGIGIPADQHEKIFEAFYQQDGSTTRKYTGVGVGLAIARRIVENHGGHIVVHSVQNEGSEFFFSLPQCAP